MQDTIGFRQNGPQIWSYQIRESPLFIDTAGES